VAVRKWVLVHFGFEKKSGDDEFDIFFSLDGEAIFKYIL